MRIYSIANSPNFGYNKELNDKVNNKLKRAKGNRELADTMLALNTYCMSTEDKLRKAEEARNKPLVDYYDALLVGIKDIATNAINDRFPELNYRKTELDTYQKEILNRKIENDDHWLVAVANSLGFSSEVDNIFDQAIAAADQAKKEGKSSEEIKKSVNSVFKNNSEIAMIDEPEKPVENPKEVKKPNPAPKVDKNKNAAGAELVELFVPGDYSAKGFVSIGGMEDLKDSITDKIIYPLKDPEAAKLDEVEYGKKMPRGELLYGPPGCGKTYFAEAMAQETGLPMYKLKISKLGSTFVNGSANNLQSAYSYIKSIADSTGKPVIMFMDEIETLTPKRDESGKLSEGNKLLGTFLQIMDEARNDKVFIIGATNLINMIDPAVASRLDNKDYIGMPDADTRRIVLTMMLNRFTKGQDLANNPEELEKVIKRTAGFSNRTLGVLVTEASDIARKDGRRPLYSEDFTLPISRHIADKINNEAIYKDKATAAKIGFNQNK